MPDSFNHIHIRGAVCKPKVILEKIDGQLFRSVVKYPEKFLQNCFFLLLFNVVLGFFDEKISSKNYGWKLWQKADKNTLLSCSGTLELKNANAEKHKKSFFQ